MSTAIAVRETEEVAQASNVLEEWANAVIARVPLMNDEELIQTAQNAGQLEKRAFIIRGACASEIRQRVEKLAGGRGNKDIKGKGVIAQLSELGTELQLDVNTLRRDADIYETFFKSSADDANPLSREYYVTALSSSDPQEAIELAKTKMDVGTYNVKQFREDVRALSTKVKVVNDDGVEELIPVNPEQLVAVYHIKASVSIEAKRALGKLCDVWGLSPDEVIQEALILALGDVE